MLKNKNIKPQTKPNKKSMCQAPVVFWIFSPIFTVGDNGPMFPRAWSASSPILHSSYSKPPPSLHTPFPQSCSPPLRSGPGLFFVEEVKPPWELSGLPPSPTFLSHLVSPLPTCHHGSRPGLSCSGSQPPCCPWVLHSLIAPSLSDIFNFSLSPDFFYSPSLVFKKKK